MKNIKQKIGSGICIIFSVISVAWITFLLFTNLGALTNAKATLAGVGQTFESLGLTDPTSMIILSAIVSIIFAIVVIISVILSYKDIGKWIPKIVLVAIPLIWIIGRFLAILPAQRIDIPFYVFVSPVNLTTGFMGLIPIDAIFILIGGLLCIPKKK